jgi:3-oxoacyl-[acyl-carrier protein] reductase
MRLENKVAIITGGGSGMGRDMAETFAREGAKVAVLDVNEQAAQAVAGGIGNAAIAIGCDVPRATDVDAAIAATTKAFGGLDILVNNAGVSHVNKPLMEIDENDFDRVFAVNVKGVFLFTQGAVPAMRARGAGVIINIGSTAGLRPRPGLAAYNATKGAVHNLTKSLAAELAPDKIRVCAIAPVATETPLLSTFLGSEENRPKFIASIPLGRLAQVEDITRVALFLASDEAAFVTGNIVEVDGGRCVG